MQVNQLQALKDNDDQKNAIDRMVELLSQELQMEIKKITNWNRLGTKKIPAEGGRTRKNQIKVSQYYDDKILILCIHFL